MERQRPTGIHTETFDEQRPLAQSYEAGEIALQQPLVSGGSNPYHSYARPGDSTSPIAATHHAGGPVAEHHIPVAISPRGGHNPHLASGERRADNRDRHHAHAPLGSFHTQGYESPRLHDGQSARIYDQRPQIVAPGTAEYREAPVYTAGGPAYQAPYSGQHHHNSGVANAALYPNMSHGMGHTVPPGRHHNAHPGAAGVVSSAPAQHVHRDSYGHDAGHVGLLVAILLLCSLVLLVQAAIDCDKRGNPWNYREDDDEWRYQGCVGTNVAYAVALAVISFVLTCVYFIQLRLCTSTRTASGCVIIRKIGLTVLMLLWLVGAFLCTFDGPYFFIGNGYFALWIGCLASVIAFGRFVLYRGLHDTYSAAGFDDGM